MLSGTRRQVKNILLNHHLIVKGEDSVYTAMAKTVGIPAAIATRLISKRKNYKQRCEDPGGERNIYSCIEGVRK